MGFHVYLINAGKFHLQSDGNHYCVHIGQFPCISLFISYFLRSTFLSREYVLVVKEENNK